MALPFPGSPPEGSAAASACASKRRAEEGSAARLASAAPTIASHGANRRITPGFAGDLGFSPGFRIFNALETLEALGFRSFLQVLTQDAELPPRSMPIAFKEWAVTVRALAEGEQLITLRKG